MCALLGWPLGNSLLRIIGPVQVELTHKTRRHVCQDSQKASNLLRMVKWSPLKFNMVASSH
jgi:hypothetical protein